MAPVASTVVAKFGPCFVLRIATSTLATAALSKYLKLSINNNNLY